MNTTLYFVDSIHKNILNLHVKQINSMNLKCKPNFLWRIDEAQSSNVKYARHNSGTSYYIFVVNLQIYLLIFETNSVINVIFLRNI